MEETKEKNLGSRRWGGSLLLESGCTKGKGLYFPVIALGGKLHTVEDEVECSRISSLNHHLVLGMEEWGQQE